MPDKHGKFRPVSFPAAPWCARCKLFACACEPASKPAPGHEHCGSGRCCGTC